MTSRARLAVLTALFTLPALSSLPTRAGAQYRPQVLVSSHVRDDMRDSARTVTSKRYAVVGAVLGFPVPGLGHVYSGEFRRGGLVFLVTMTGAYFALNDASPQAAATVGSVFYVGGWLFSVVDGAFAADRYNERHEVKTVAGSR